MPKYEDYRGLRFFFYSAEEGRPHVHVRSQDGIAKFWLSPEIELDIAGGVKPRDLKAALERIVEMRDEYLRRWEEHYGQESG